MNKSIELGESAELQLQIRTHHLATIGSIIIATSQELYGHQDLIFDSNFFEILERPFVEFLNSNCNVFYHNINNYNLNREWYRREILGDEYVDYSNKGKFRRFLDRSKQKIILTLSNNLTQYCLELLKSTEPVLVTFDPDFVCMACLSTPQNISAKHCTEKGGKDVDYSERLRDMKNTLGGIYASGITEIEENTFEISPELIQRLEFWKKVRE